MQGPTQEDEYLVDDELNTLIVEGNKEVGEGAGRGPSPSEWIK